MDKLKIIWAQVKANLPGVLTGYPYSSAVLFVAGFIAGAVLL